MLEDSKACPSVAYGKERSLLFEMVSPSALETEIVYKTSKMAALINLSK